MSVVARPARPCREPIGAERDGICAGCHRHTYLRKETRIGWRCPDCNHYHEGRFRAARRDARRIDHGQVVSLGIDRVPVAEIALRLGITYVSVRRILQQSGVRPTLTRKVPRSTYDGRPRRVEISRDLLDAYPQMTAAAIACVVGCSKATVYRNLRDSGATIAYQHTNLTRRPQLIERSRASVARARQIDEMRKQGRKWIEVALELDMSESNAGRLHAAYLRGELLAQRMEAS